MKTAVSKVAVVGSGISGAVCASILARNGASVTIFESARGPGGRMSQRRETAEDGKELYFDHGAPLFTVNNKETISLVCEWEERGLVAEWKENFGIYDCADAKFFGIEKGQSTKKYVGVPGMNAICRALCHEPGVEATFGINIGTLQWVEDKNSWLPIDLNGQTLGTFDALVVSDKNIASSRSTTVTGRPPPLDISLVPDLSLQTKEVPVLSCFSLMLAFSEPLTSIPVRGFSFKNSDVLSWAFCDSSKPGRSNTSEHWVLHSTTEYAKRVISKTGLQKLSSSILTGIAEELFMEFQRKELNIPRPCFMRAHRCEVSALAPTSSWIGNCSVRCEENCIVSLTCDKSRRSLITPHRPSATISSPITDKIFPPASVNCEESSLSFLVSRVATLEDVQPHHTRYLRVSRANTRKSVLFVHKVKQGRNI